MNCPNCNIQLLDNEQNGVDVGYCTTCQGVWLDSRELDNFMAPAPKAQTSIRIPSVSSQKQANFELIYDGAQNFSHMKAG